ncbi:GNAT family N-acetyltransferase [Massilia jejuensis]|uniref:GNAT family N-acetyltransferase n=1 Tax=Massilia jejuensis TaxID=648894 RepID=A0ABW0PDC8_9BURK
MSLLLLTGHHAVTRADAADFRAAWETLYARCAWATACQHPDFVAPWYALYMSSSLPVMVVDERDDGSLDGLLALALRPGGGMLTGAGDQQAEYQGWLQASGGDSRFIVRAIELVRAQFPDADICLKYLPPGIPLRWIDEAHGYRGLCCLRSYSLPLMRIDADVMNRQRNKKNHRQNFNRLKRVGEVRFEQVVDHQHFERVFDEICMQYDFRQAALYRTMPFSKDPFKKRFQLALHKNGLLHTTVLSVGDRIAASHIGLLSKGRAVHLGINTYDPALAAHSPGNLLLAMLGVHLVAQGIPVLDLTAGGDQYKEHFATEHDSVRELIVYRDRKSRWTGEARRGAIRYAKARLRAAGYRPADVAARFEEIKRFGLSDVRAAWTTLGRGHQCHMRALHHATHAPGAHTLSSTALPIGKNRLQDVFAFDAHGDHARYCTFLDTVMKRMERSGDLYSYVRNGQLQMLCWAGVHCVEPPSGASVQASGSSATTIVLSDMYVHPEARHEAGIRQFLAQLLLEVAQARPGSDVVYRGRLSKQLHSLLTGCGFIDALP